MLFNVNELLISLSWTLDVAEKNMLKANSNHGMRVAYIAARIAQALDLPLKQRFDLVSYALLHDNGIMASVRKKTQTNRSIEFSAEADPDHCIEGEKNVAAFPFLAKRENIILYHHEHYDGSGFFGIRGDHIPQFSRIIFLADYIAVRFSQGWGNDEIIDAVKHDSGYFDPVLRDVLFDLSHNLEFWLGMDDQFVQNTLIGMLPQANRVMDYRQVRGISQIFSRIIDDKSPFTGSHSRGISEKVGFICQYYEFDEKMYWKMRIAADLHDLGKLAVPNVILDKPGKLNRQEFQVIQSHPFYTRKILSMINGFEEITEWASNHHEKLNGSGYPYSLSADRLDFNSRILVCVDIYQALTEDRPYRKGMNHSEAIKILYGMAKSGLIEESVTEDMDSIFRDA